MRAGEMSGILGIHAFHRMPEDAIQRVFIDGENHNVHYLRQPFRREPDFGAASVNYYFADLLASANRPS